MWNGTAPILNATPATMKITPNSSTRRLIAARADRLRTLRSGRANRSRRTASRCRTAGNRKPARRARSTSSRLRSTARASRRNAITAYSDSDISSRPRYSVRKLLPEIITQLAEQREHAQQEEVAAEQVAIFEIPARIDDRHGDSRASPPLSSRWRTNPPHTCDRRSSAPCGSNAFTANQMPAISVEKNAMKYVVRRPAWPTNVSLSHATTTASITSASGNRAVIGAFCMIFRFLRSALLWQRQLGLRDVGEEVFHGYVHHIGKGLRIQAHEQRQCSEHCQHEEFATVDVEKTPSRDRWRPRRSTRACTSTACRPRRESA